MVAAPSFFGGLSVWARSSSSFRSGGCFSSSPLILSAMSVFRSGCFSGSRPALVSSSSRSAVLRSGARIGSVALSSFMLVGLVFAMSLACARAATPLPEPVPPATEYAAPAETSSMLEQIIETTAAARGEVLGGATQAAIDATVTAGETGAVDAAIGLAGAAIAADPITWAGVGLALGAEAVGAGVCVDEGCSLDAVLTATERFLQSGASSSFTASPGQEPAVCWAPIVGVVYGCAGSVRVQENQAEFNGEYPSDPPVSLSDCNTSYCSENPTGYHIDQAGVTTCSWSDPNTISCPSRPSPWITFNLPATLTCSGADALSVPTDGSAVTCAGASPAPSTSVDPFQWAQALSSVSGATAKSASPSLVAAIANAVADSCCANGGGGGGVPSASNPIEFGAPNPVTPSDVSAWQAQTGDVISVGDLLQRVAPNSQVDTSSGTPQPSVAPAPQLAGSTAPPAVAQAQLCGNLQAGEVPCGEYMDAPVPNDDSADATKTATATELLTDPMTWLQTEFQSPVIDEDPNLPEKPQLPFDFWPQILPNATKVQVIKEVCPTWTFKTWWNATFTVDEQCKVMDALRPQMKTILPVTYLLCALVFVVMA